MVRRSSRFLPSRSRPTAYVLAALLAGVAGAAHAEDAAATAPPSDNELEPIVVTARKVKENLQDVPLAISAFGGDQLRQNDHIRIEDLNQLAPSTNVVITNGHQTSFTVRGLGANPANDGLESSAGVFLDGVYLGRPGMVAMDMIDINQVELLRGPQGTLFGKNTTAGAVNITTALPSFDFGARAQVSLGNYGYQQYQGSITGPITDTLAGRLTAFKTTRDGTVDNIYLGGKTADQDREGVRGQLLYKPNEDFSVRLIGEYSREQQSSGAVLVLNSMGASSAALQAKLNAVNAKVAIDPDGQTTAIDGAAQTGTRQAAFSAEVNWKVGGFTLTSLTAYRKWRYESLSDGDGTSADVVTGGYNLHDQQWSQELRLTFPHMGPFDAIAGLYYFGQDVRTDQITEYGADAAAWLSGIPNALLPIYAKSSPALAALLAYNGSRWDTWADPSTRSYAAFGQVSWHINPNWNFTAGARVTRETKEEDVWRPNPTSLATGQPSAALAYNTAAPVHASVSDTAPSFLFSTDYHLTPGVMVYGLVSRGEKAGGINTVLPAAGLGPDSLKVRPEVATNYEVGVKADLLQHRLQVNASLFRTDVTDYQATYIEVVNGTTNQLLTNVGEVRTQGVEAEATLRPIAGLSLHAFVGYNDAKYTSYTDGPCPVEITGRPSCDLSGRPVAGAPKWTTGISGSYEHSLGANLTGYFGGEYSWRSSFYGALDDSNYSLTGDYGLLNLRLGVRSADGRWDVALWGKNVTDEHYVSNYLSYGSLLPGVYVPFFGDPATYGVTLRAAF